MAHPCAQNKCSALWGRSCLKGKKPAKKPGRKNVSLHTTLIVTHATNILNSVFYAPELFSNSILLIVYTLFTALIFVTIHVVLNVLGIYHRMPLIIIAHITHFILCTIAALAFLISSSITFSKFTDWRVHVGSVFGLIAMGLFILEAVHNFIQHKRGANEQQATKSKDPEAPKPIEGQPPSY